MPPATRRPPKRKAAEPKPRSKPAKKKQHDSDSDDEYLGSDMEQHEEGDDEDEDDYEPGYDHEPAPAKRPAKKQKTVKSPKSKVAEPAASEFTSRFPNNETLPQSLGEQWAPCPDGHIKVATWMVNGLRAALKKGADTYLDTEQPAIVCMQETKMQTKPASNLFSSLDFSYPHKYFAYPDEDVKGGHAGSAVLSTIKPLKVTYGLRGTDLEDDDEGRTITLEFPGVFVVTAYVPNAGRDLQRLALKRDWDRALTQYVRELDRHKPVLVCGDMNVAHGVHDLARPTTNAKTAGFMQQERDGFTAFLDATNMVDVWRHQHQLPQEQYTFFSRRVKHNRAKGIGWRLDYIVTSERLVPLLGECAIRDEVFGPSDHVPVVVTAPCTLFERQGPGGEGAGAVAAAVEE
ncbi:DNA-(apurinic or apyrimidinic site) lyase [Allomyces javanicus]|nr:DNA-(apurinic or apyrimidinic site) lyase [Allomyces javanicus]